MRAFIAIELPVEIREYLKRVQEELKNSQADVKWVKPQNIHLTLKFLGEIDSQQLERIIKIIDEVCAQRRPFYMRLTSIGAFPTINSPRIIWIGIDKDQQESEEIAKALEGKISRIGIPREEKKFSAHITIGRTKSAKNRHQMVESLNLLKENIKKAQLEFQVHKITLFKSTLTPQGPIYEILNEGNLKTT